MFEELIGKLCVVRTYSAGVEIGVLASVSADGKQAKLTNSRKLWRWYGASTLHELASSGCDPRSKISEPVASVYLTEVIEMIPCTEQAAKVLAELKWGDA